MPFSTFSGGIICASTATYGTESAGTTFKGAAMPVAPQYPLTHRHLFEFDASVSPEIAIRRGADPARLSIWYFTGGQFLGEKLKGVLLPGGGDWAVVQNEDQLRIDVRAVLQTDDAALVYMTYRGLWRAVLPGALTRLFRDGQPYKHEDHYLRVTAGFETDAARYSWLNGIVAVGVGGYAEGGVHYSFYAAE